MKERPNELAPCGVFCGACPSYGKTCFGYPSESRAQKRTSKWNCRIRRCCYDTMKKGYCIECDRFPCEIIKKKLIDSHPEDPRFNYRHEIPAMFPVMKEIGTDAYIEIQKNRWTCPSCGGTILFYHHKCNKCGRMGLVNRQKIGSDPIYTRSILGEADMAFPSHTVKRDRTDPSFMLKLFTVSGLRWYTTKTVYVEKTTYPYPWYSVGMCRFTNSIEVCTRNRYPGVRSPVYRHIVRIETIGGM